MPGKIGALLCCGNACVTLLVLLQVVDKKRNERVVGFHYVGPNAGEITQALSLSVS